MQQRVKKIIRNATDTPKKRRTGLIILLILASLITGGLFYWNAYKKSIIKGELDKVLDKETKGLYTLHYSKFNLDEVGGSLLVDSISLKYDSVVYNQQLETGKAPSLLVNLFVPQLSVSGVETPKALIDKEIQGNKLQLLAPIIEIIYTGKGKDSMLNVPADEVYRQLLGNLRMIRIKEIEISNATLITRKLNKKDTSLQVKSLTVRLNDLFISDSTSTDSTRLLFSKHLWLSADKINWEDKKKLYDFRLDSVVINSADRSLSVLKWRMDPLLGEDAHMRRIGTQKDRFDIVFNKLHLKNLNFPKLLKESIEADTLILENATVKVYKDHHQPRDGVNRVGTYPHQLLLKAPLNINIRKGFIYNSYIEYKQNTVKSDMKGVVSFHNTSLAIDNITNVKELISKNKICRIDARTSFLNMATLKATFYFNLASENGAFSIDGKLSGFDAKKLNPVTEPMAVAKVEKGTINDADIHIEGSDYKGKAKIILLYDDLKIAVLKKEEDEKKLKKKGLISFAANLLIKNSNPGKNEKVREGNGTFERDTNRAFFNLVWKSLFVAIADAMGIEVKGEPKK